MDTKTTHTPGPWEVHEGLDYIVVMRGDETTEQGIRVDNIEDARLIAAATELLEACKRVLIERLGSLEEAAKWANQYGDNPNSAQDLLAVIRAIVKAEGK